MVSLALRCLQLTEPGRAVGFSEAIVLGKHGGDRRSEKAKDQGANGTLKRNSSAYALVGVQHMIARGAAPSCGQPHRPHQ